jgi:hypothetical protein
VVPEAFECGTDGVWHCRTPFIFRRAGDFLYCAPGTTYKPGTAYNGFDVGGILEAWRFAGHPPAGYEFT